jgi:hypothetical protein
MNTNNTIAIDQYDEPLDIYVGNYILLVYEDFIRVYNGNILVAEFKNRYSNIQYNEYGLILDKETLTDITKDLNNVIVDGIIYADDLVFKNGDSLRSILSKEAIKENFIKED